jgi:hypothetical protein
MFFMGEEFFDTKLARHMRMAWPEVSAGGTLNAMLDANEAFKWTSGLLKLRRRYPGLRMSGDNPALGDRFSFILGRWMGPRQGGGNQVLGWRARAERSGGRRPGGADELPGVPVEVDLDLGIPGRWVRLAYIDEITGPPPEPRPGARAFDDPAQPGRPIQRLRPAQQQRIHLQVAVTA